MYDEYDNDEYGFDAYDDSYDEDNEFEDCNGESALRKETKDNPRNLPCPTCGEPDMLTPKDVKLGYQCDMCAERMERGY